MDIKRIETGIDKLDGLIEGGFPSNSSILVSGPSGTGKTIFCTQFLMHGAKKGEKGLYVALEERPSDVRREMTRFSWDLAKFEEEGTLLMLDVANPRARLPSKEKYSIQTQFDVESFANKLYEMISQNDIKRVVIDSLPALTFHFGDFGEIRNAIHEINNLLLELGCTVVLVSETVDFSQGVSRFGVEEFVASGVIVLTYADSGTKMTKNLLVLKMRGTKHAVNRYPYQISNSGIDLQIV
jgi:KaiC/GvpD/RAD55 family RecA-like ATPase